MPILLSLLLLSLYGCASNPGTSHSVHFAPVKHQQGISKERDEIVTTAQAMLGRPYQYGGISPNGFDCSGLVYFSHSQAGILLPRTTLAQFKHSRPVALSHLQPGDLLFFKLNGAKTSHVGIYIGKGKFIHAPSSGKVVSVATIDNTYWQKHLVGAGSFL